MDKKKKEDASPEKNKSICEDINKEKGLKGEDHPEIENIKSICKVIDKKKLKQSKPKKKK